MITVDPTGALKGMILVIVGDDPAVEPPVEEVLLLPHPVIRIKLNNVKDIIRYLSIKIPS